MQRGPNAIPLDLAMKPFRIPAIGGHSACAHEFTETEIYAINAAIAAGRPLLVRGAPGTGKSQLARAAAYRLGRRFVSKVIDARTETRDLFYAFDAVARLAKAQLQGALRFESGGDPGSDERRADVLEAAIAEKNFIKPGPLWWAFHWPSAAAQAEHVNSMAPPSFETEDKSECRSENGVVLLLDEIDKADPSLPNGLLEALGNRQFDVMSMTPVTAREGQAAPLVVITTNEERSLPDAFLRRCMVLCLGLPDEEASWAGGVDGTEKKARTKDELIRDVEDWLVVRGRRHFDNDCDGEVLAAAAKIVVRDRFYWRAKGLAAPGQAEYLDLVRALVEMTSKSGDGKQRKSAQMDLLKKIAPFALQKHPRHESV